MIKIKSLLKESHTLSPDAIKAIKEIKKLIVNRRVKNRGFNSAENAGLIASQDIIDSYLKSNKPEKLSAEDRYWLGMSGPG